MRTKAGGEPELRGEMHSAEARRAGKVLQPDLIREIGFDELGNPTLPPSHESALLRPPIHVRPWSSPDHARHDRLGNAFGIVPRLRAIEVVAVQ